MILFFTQAADKDNSGDLTKDEYDTFIKCIGTSKKVKYSLCHSNLNLNYTILNNKSSATFTVNRYSFL